MVKEHDKAILRAINSLAVSHSSWRTFRDFVEMCALSISNSVDKFHYDEREKRYLEIIGGYAPNEQKLFPEMFGELALALEDSPRDVLGEIFHALELHNRFKGQFFTPQNVSDMTDCAKTTLRNVNSFGNPKILCGRGVLAEKRVF